MAHIGVIEELLKHGFEITSIAGVSMGAVIGGVYVLGELDAYKNWLYTLDKSSLFSLADFAFGIQGIIKGDKLINTVKAFIPDKNIEDLSIPFAAVAADIVNKKEVVFTEGSIFDAVRASMAFPTVFTPIRTSDGGLLVDGGIINNIPINRVKRTPNDILIVVNVNADIPLEKRDVEKNDTNTALSSYHKKIKDFYNQFHIFNNSNGDEKPGYFNLINKSLNLMTYQIAKMSLEMYPHDMLINVSQHSCGIFDFFRAEELVEIGRNATIKTLQKFDI